MCVRVFLLSKDDRLLLATLCACDPYLVWLLVAVVCCGCLLWSLAAVAWFGCLFLHLHLHLTLYLTLTLTLYLTMHLTLTLCDARMQGSTAPPRVRRPKIAAGRAPLATRVAQAAPTLP